MKKLTIPAMTETAAPDPQPLRAALAKAKRSEFELADFREVTIPQWQAEYAQLVKSGDPHDAEHLRDAAHAAERVVMAKNYLLKFERELTPVMNAALRAVQDFDRAFLAAADAEYAALLDEIAAVLRPYCRDVEQVTDTPGYQTVDAKGVPLASQGINRIVISTARTVARGCTILSYIPRSFDALAGHFAPEYALSLTIPDHLTWREVPTFEEASVAAGYGADGRAVAHPVTQQLGGFKMNDLALAGHATTRRAPLPGEVFREQPAASAMAVQANANFLRIVWGRAEALLERYEAWHAAGDRFVPQNFADLGPLMLPDAAPPVVHSVAANLGGAAKDMRAHGGHGVPTVDLQRFEL